MLDIADMITCYLIDVWYMIFYVWLYLSCQARHYLDEVIGHPLVVRRKKREMMGAVYFDASVYSQGNLACLPEALKPKPGRLSPTQ